MSNEKKSSKKLPKTPKPKKEPSILKPGMTCQERERRAELRNTYLDHKTFGKCRIKAARYTGTQRNMFLVDTENAGEKSLIADVDYWNETASVITSVFERFENDSARIEKCLAAKIEAEKKRAPEVEALEAEAKAETEKQSVETLSHNIEVSPDLDATDLQRRQRRLDLTSFASDDLFSNRSDRSNRNNDPRDCSLFP